MPLRRVAVAALALAAPAAAHNGAVAYALPVHGLVADGDLSDWPASRSYAIRRMEIGAAPTDSIDFVGSFRLGWDEATGSLWVAVEIDDDDVVLEGESVTSWRDMRRFFGMMGWRSSDEVEVPPLADGCAVVIDVGHESEDSRTVRFGLDGTDRRTVFTSSERDTVEWGAAEVGTQLSETARVYEWRIDLHSEFLRESDVAAPDLAAGTTLGFDVTVADRDHDGSLSWMMWGPGVGKVWGSRFSRRGDAVLVTEAVVMGRLDGRAAWTDPLESKPPTAVLVQPDSGATRWVAATDDDGVFSVGVPVGGYVLSLDDERLGRDRRLTTARVAAGAPTTVTVVDEPLFPADLRERALQRAPILKPPPAGKQHGVSWVGSRIVGRAEVASLEQAKAAWIVQTPFGWQRDVKAPVLRAPTGEAGLWGESDRGVAITTALSRERGVATLLKPHIWTGRDTWRGELAMSTEEDWATWFDQYETFIVHYARLAEATGIEGLCIGTELSATVHREAEWRRVIEGVREVYGGWLVYAANWNTFEKVPFWDAVDFIGVQAYFPLSEVATDDVDTLVAGWQPWLSRLQAAAQATDRRVLFTEIGYRTNANAAVEPWLWERQTEGGGDATGQRTQAACYEAFFRAAWHHDWVAGAYFWKWFPHHDRAGGGDDDGFTPQNKLAQQVLADWYGRPLRQPVFPTAGPASSAASE